MIAMPGSTLRSRPTQLTVQDLWDNLAAVADFLNVDYKRRAAGLSQQQQQHCQPLLSSLLHPDSLLRLALSLTYFHLCVGLGPSVNCQES